MKPVTEILLTFLLNALWQGTLIVAFAAGGDWLLRGVAPRFRHYLWVVTLLACLTIPALSCLPQARSMTTPNVASAPAGPIPVVTSRIITPGVEDLTARALTDNLPVRTPFAGSRAVLVPARVAFTLVGLYLLIVLWRLLGLMRAWRRTNHIVAAAFACDFPDWVQNRISECQSEFGIKSARVLCSNDVAVPITVGVFDRIVILPQRFTREVSIDVLTSALGHEFQHIARHDYLLNLVYEFIYLPLAFHPAVAFARRRIKHTRELCCDAAVTNRLVPAEVYARSLVKLVGSAPLLPLAPDTTIGMNESDILEVRIMALLKKSNLSSRRRVLLLVAAASLLITPCVAAARYALSFETNRQTPQRESSSLPRKTERAEIENLVVDLELQSKELKQRLEQMPPSKQVERATLEAKLNEITRSIEEQRKALGASQLSSQNASEQRLKQTLEELQKNGSIDQAKAKEKLEQLLAQATNSKSQADAELIRQIMDKITAEQAASQGDRKPRLLSHTEARYTDDARAKGIVGKVVLGFTVDHDGIPQGIQVKQSLYPSLDQAAIEAVREWRFAPAMKNGQVVSTWLEVQVNFNLYQDPEKKETQERRERELVERAATVNGQEIRVRTGNEAARRAEREAEEKRNAILAGMAKITMDHAIQIAGSKAPGKVIECSLVGEHWEGPAELAKPSLVLYHVIILSEDATPTRTHVLVNAQDGSVFRVSKEEKRQEEEMTGYANYTSEGTTRRAINGGVLNGKAVSLPAPQYPAIARAAHASGPVNVQILIDEGGNVIEATPVSGHPLLRAAAEAAAKEAKFSSTRLNGEPVRVSGVLVFNFVAQ